jgi:hypothetical protein
MARLGKFLFDIFIQRLHIIADKLDATMSSKGLIETREQKRKQYYCCATTSQKVWLQSKLSEALNTALGRLRFLHFSDRVTQYH